MPKQRSIAIKPRLTIPVTHQQYEGLKKHLEYGMIRKCFEVVIEDMLAMLDEHGQHFVIALLQKRISYREFMEDYVKRNSN